MQLKMTKALVHVLSEFTKRLFVPVRQYGGPSKPDGHCTIWRWSMRNIHLPGIPLKSTPVSPDTGIEDYEWAYMLLVSFNWVALIPDIGATTLLGGSGATMPIWKKH